MRKSIFGMALLVAFAASAASVTAPEAGKAYNIRNGGGLYMTSENSSLYLHELDGTNADQRFEFIAVEGVEGAYNIKMNNGEFIGSDGKWSVFYKTDPADNMAQFKIVVSAADPELVNLVCVGSGKNLGCDSTTDGSNTYTDKGDDKESYRWSIELAKGPVSVTEPAADKYYRIRHVSGFYLTDTRFGSTIAEKVDDNSQIYQFVASGEEGAYNIKRVRSGMFVGSNGKWSSCPISRDVPMSRHAIVLAEDESNVSLKNLGMAAANEAKACMGVDDVKDGAAVYTDKAGTDVAKQLWFIEPAKKYDEPIPAGLANLVANGDFEDPGFVQEKNAESGQMGLSELPGWTVPQNDTWNGLPSIGEADGNHYLVLAGYPGNGWASVVMNQALTNLVPGHDYVFTFDVKHPTDDGCSWGYRLAGGKGIVAEKSENSVFDEWKTINVRFNAASEKLTVMLYLDNKNTWWRDKFLYIDNVALYDLTPVDFYAEHQLPADDPRANAYEGYKLVFAQEFSGSGTPDHEIWNFEEGFKRNNEDQYYNSDKNTYIQDGVLVIEGKYVLDEKIPNPKYSKYNTGWPSRIGKYLTWTSGSMQTKGAWDGGYTWNYGIYEVRARVPQYVGSWPAIWSTGMQYEWPYGGEIDIMEYYGNRIHANVCWGDGKRWAGHWNSATVHDDILGEGWGDEYHIWRMVWDYDHMELWCDDMLVNNINLDTTNNDIPEGDLAGIDHGNGCNPFRDVRHMLWLNLALGGNNGGSLDKTPHQLYYLIDYARVYQKVGTDGKAKYSVEETVSDPTFVITGVEDIAVENEDEVTGVYNLQGIRVADKVDTVRGSNQVYIVVRGEVASKVVL